MMWRPRTARPTSAKHDDLLNASSLGTSGARQLRQRTPAAQAHLTRAVAPLRDAVFISYRHDDPAAGGLAMLLEGRLGRSLGPDRVLDVTRHVAPGKTAAGSVRGAVHRCSVVVAIIGRGRQWNLLRSPADWMHIEIAHALQLGKPVLPVLLDDVPMVRPGQLPLNLAALAGRQYLRFTGAGDIDTLIATIMRLVQPQPELHDRAARPGEPAHPDIGFTGHHGRTQADAAVEPQAAGGGRVATVRRSASAVAEAPGRRIVGAERRTIAKDLVRRYTSGESIRALAASTGRSYGFVHRMLTESGVQLRQRGGARRRKKA